MTGLKRAERRRTALSKICAEKAYPNVTYVSGTDIIPNMTYISADDVHPNIYGIDLITEKLTKIVKSKMLDKYLKES